MELMASAARDAFDPIPDPISDAPRLSFWNPPRSHRLSRRFKLFLVVAYPAAFMIAFVVLHFARLHYVRVAGTAVGFDTDRDTAKFLGMFALFFALICAVPPLILLAIAGILKLLLVLMDRFDRTPPASPGE
jgi:hypothetical protein